MEFRAKNIVGDMKVMSLACTKCNPVPTTTYPRTQMMQTRGKHFSKSNVAKFSEKKNLKTGLTSDLLSASLRFKVLVLGVLYYMPLVAEYISSYKRTKHLNIYMSCLIEN